TVCVVGKMRDLILQLSKSSIYSTKPFQIYPTPNRCIYIQPCIMSTRNYANRQKEVSKNIKEEFAI
ncbi:hypothetical protein ACOY70_23650, partial [Enterobacter asburiae]